MRLFDGNRPRSIYQYSSMAPRLSGQNCKFFKFPFSLNPQKRLRYKESNTKYRGLTWKPRSHVRILIYRTWLIEADHFYGNGTESLLKQVKKSLMSRIERKHCLISTSYVAALFDILILLHIWQNCVCFGDFLPMRTLCVAYHKEFESY